MGIKCDRCDTENSDNAKFCGNCGTSLSANESVSAAPEEAEYNGSWRLTDVIRSWLTEMEWEELPALDKASGISRIKFLVDAGDLECTCYLEAWEPHETCKLFVYP